MAEAMPGLAGKTARDRLFAMQRNTFEKVTTGGDEASCFPEGDELFFIKFMGQIFSVSDLRHAVVTPYFLFIGQCLTQVRCNGGRDICSALFLANLLIHFISESKRYIPELICFLRELLIAGFNLPNPYLELHEHPEADPDEPSMASDFDYSPLPGTFRSGSHIWQHLGEMDARQVSSHQLDLSTLFYSSNQAAVFESPTFLAASAKTTFNLLKQLVQIYDTLPSFPEVFSPFVDILGQLKLPKHDTILTETCASLKQLLQQRIDTVLENRRPLELRKFRPIPIRSIKPRFDEEYFPGKDTDPDRDRVEQRKLKKKVKQEKRGAIRELRKDAQFIALQRAHQYQVQAQDKEKKKKEIRSWLESQAADTNPLRHSSKKKK
eukprot:TRINITY_DN3078_c0_g2_i8.p1 TRINITY_DN3078_c0_g2~~TRINITY_DN3078_c0_g2_i8.p1  ORF type:complete len:416 (-),score=122.85 TRINITY_DN3078_c0_g2_i8:25-1161(-)